MATTTISMRRKMTDMCIKNVSSRTTLMYGRLFLLMLAGFSAGCTIVPGLDLGLGRDRVGAPNGIGGFDLKLATPELVLQYANQGAPIVSRRRLLPVDPLLDASSGSGAVRYEYKVGAGDVLNIIVWNHPELTNPAGEFRDAASAGRLVGPDGTIFYPYIGELKVSEHSVTEIRKEIAEKLARVIRDPQVDVRVASFRSQNVKLTGELERPGIQAIDDRPLTILQAISAAGGLTPASNRRHVVLTRAGDDYLVPVWEPDGEGRRGGDLRLRDGDVLHVPNNDDQKVFVLGAVGTQSSLLMPRGEMTLAEVISEVNGLNAGGADPKKIFVVRRESVPDFPGSGAEELSPRTVLIQFSFSNVEDLVLSEHFPVWPRDIVYVDRTGLATYNSVIGQILPTVSTLFQLERLLDRD